MSNIKKYRDIIEQASERPTNKLVEDTEHLPDDSIFEHDNGMTYMFMYLESDGLNEDIAGTLSTMFRDAKGLMGDLKAGTNDVFKRKMRQVLSKYNSGMNNDMKKQVKEVTKKLKDKYYFDYNLTLQAFEKRNALYSKEFFQELMKSFSLDPDVERQVWKEYSPQIKRFITQIREFYKEYMDKNPDAAKPERVYMTFHYLPKRLQKNVVDDANYLVGSIIGFTAAVAIANFFQKNPAKFKESSEVVLESVDVSGIIKTKTIDKIYDDIQKESEDSIIRQLENMDDIEDKEFDWSDDIEDEHDTIYSQYIKEQQQ